MYFVEERIRRFINDIQALVCTAREEVRGLKVRYGEIPKDVKVDSVTGSWQDYAMGTPWSGSYSGEYALFKTRLEIPEKFYNKKVVLGIRTNKNGWNALNPQMLVYINGNEYQGLDTNHREILLDNNVQERKSYDVAIYAFSGLKHDYNLVDDSNEVKLFVDLEAIDSLIEDFYYNLKVPLQLALQLPEGSMDKIKLLNILNDVINKVDLRIAYSKEFYSSLEEANDYVKENLYSGSFGQDALVTCVGHTHIDVAWLWRYCHTREKTVRSFTTVLSLMDQYPEYLFMSSQPQLYEFLKEDHPGVYERVKNRVKEGRWEPEGGMWVESDTNVPSGESLVRQFLYGKRFFEKEFGVESKILWLPDVFGYSGALPQIMKKSGIDYFMTAKLKNNEFNKFPYHTFMWRGIDGTEVLSHITIYCPNFYNGMADQGDIVESWNNYEQKSINNDVIFPYGYGDGGGGPTKEMLETIRRYNNGLPGAPAAKPGKAGEFFDRLNERVRGNRQLPTWVGELYYEVHRGTYTSMAKNKKNNRKAEFLYTTAEWAASLNGLLFGTYYPSEELNRGWKDILLNQFHDVLPGSSIKDVYKDTDVIYSKIFESGKRILEEGLDRIAASISTDCESLTVFNQLSWERKGLVEFVYPSDKKLIYLVSDDGKTFVCQKVGEKENGYIAAVGGISPKGYSTFKISGDASCTYNSNDSISISKTLLENKFFRISVDGHGNFTNIFDKQAGREVLKPGERGNVLQAFEDKPRGEDNWNLDIFYSEKMWQVDDVEYMDVLESGPVRGMLRIARKFLNSSIIQDVILYNDIPRIDFKTFIDWKEKDIVLKAAFPVDINADRATYEIQFGHIERNTHWNTTWDMAKFEVCGHKWADLSENGYGVSLLNDCKYGYDIKDNRMRLTLLRCGTMPNPDADKEVHEFTYSLYPHSEDWREGGTVQEAYDLNCPLTGRVVGKQDGSLPGSLAMVKVNKENVIVEVVKKAEENDETILRVYEAYNRRGKVKVNLYKNIKRITECNLMEKEDEEVRFDGSEFSFNIKPLEIKTFKVRWEN